MEIERVALISYHTCPNALLGQGKAGGMNVYVRELARHFGQRGVKVDIFTRAHQGQEAPTVCLSPNVRVIHLYGGPIDATLDSLPMYVSHFTEALRRYQRENRLKYQVVHSHYWLAAWVGRDIAAEWEVPHAATFHTLAETKKQARSGEQEPQIRSALEAEIMASAQLLVSSSVHEKEAMVRLYGAPEERIHVVPCGVDLSLFQPLDAYEARARLGLNGEKIILFVGRIEPLKGVELLCQTAAIMEVDEPFKVLIVGGDPDSQGEVEALRRLGRGLGIANTLEFVGSMDQKVLPLYYSAADVCIVPSYYESFSLVALEAMACGTPVVACRVGGLSTVVEHGTTGYLHALRCPEPMAQSLQVLLSSRTLKEAMGVAARKRAETMGWDAVAGRLLALYQSALSAPSTPL